MTRLLIVDDVALFRTGLAAALDDAGFEVVGEAIDSESAVSAAEELQPDVVVLDVLMPGISGIDAVEKILAVSPESRIMLLTGSESEEDLLKGVRAGVRGYLNKNGSFESLGQAIKDIAAGGAAISPMMGGKLFDVVRQLLRHQDLLASRHPTLTSREVEVLQRVAEGYTSRAIGELLFISENTVKNHVRNILDKLGVHSRNEAVLFALREGLITL